MSYTKDLLAWIMAILTLLGVVYFLPHKREEISFGAKVKDVATLQERYFAKEGKYLQILEGNRLPHYEQGTVTAKLGVPVDAKYAVDVYESPNGRGYRIRWEDESTIYSIGYGADAVKYTFTVPKIIIVAPTSTST